MKKKLQVRDMLKIALLMVQDLLGELLSEIKLLDKAFLMDLLIFLNAYLEERSEDNK